MRLLNSREYEDPLERIQANGKGILFLKHLLQIMGIKNTCAESWTCPLKPSRTRSCGSKAQSPAWQTRFNLPHCMTLINWNSCHWERSKIDELKWRKKAYSFYWNCNLPASIQIRLSMRHIGRQAWYKLGILPEYPKGLESFFPHLPQNWYVCWKWRPSLSPCSKQWGTKATL